MEKSPRPVKGDSGCLVVVGWTGSVRLVDSFQECRRRARGGFLRILL